MPKIDLDKDTRAKLTDGLSRYLRDELDLEVKGFDAQFLLDFITERLGPYYYNQGLHDARRRCSPRRSRASPTRSMSWSSR